MRFFFEFETESLVDMHMRMTYKRRNSWNSWSEYQSIKNLKVIPDNTSDGIKLHKYLHLKMSNIYICAEMQGPLKAVLSKVAFKCQDYVRHIRTNNKMTIV